MPAMGGLPSELLRYSYDSWGRLSGIRGASIILGSTIYSPIGQLAEFSRANGSSVTAYSTYGYDPATGAVMSILDNAVFGGEGHYVADRTYTRDSVGNVTSSTMNSTLPTAGTQKVCYTYDGLRELTRAWTPNAATNCSATPSAATMGGVQPYWHNYTYDTMTGNRTSLVKRSTTGTVSTATYAYPAAGGDRPHSVNTVTGPAGMGPGSYSYDAAGNMTGRPGQTITFNDVGKVSKVVAGSVTQDTVYNVDGNILLRTNTTEGASLFLGDTVLSQAPGSAVVSGVRTYSGAEGKPVAEKSAKTGTAGTTLTWLFSNLEGTVDVQTVANAVGTTTRTFRDPYGAPIGSSGVWGSGTGYMNKPVTASTGLTTVGARTYDPVLGKFLSVDPVIDTNLPQQNTGYTYSGNNPTTYMDPTGLRLDQGCGWGVNCTRSGQKKVSKPNPWTGVGPFSVKKTTSTKPQQKPRTPSLISTLTPKAPAKSWIPKAQPAWGPLISLRPGYEMPVPEAGIGVQLCAGVCLAWERGARGSNSFAITAGLHVEASVTVGVSAEEAPGFYVVGECSVVAGSGAGVQIGAALADRPSPPGGVQLNGTSSAGVRFGGGGGCGAGAKWSW
nr:RHS repeat-associated core domain-containing protein [uncultured Microbacterium sp.]